MGECVKVVIIDDHPLITKAYKEALEIIFTQLGCELELAICENIDQCLKLISNDYFNDVTLVFIDIKLPKSKDGKFLSGEDLGIRIRKRYNCKIVIATTFNDNYRIYSIIKSINPDGFLIKNDLTYQNLLQSINAILKNEFYYSKTVLNLISKEIHRNYHLDELDRRILYELSIGTKMKSLPKIIPLSIAGIEKRKRSLKLLFGLENEDDRELIMVAREKGFI